MPRNRIVFDCIHDQDAPSISLSNLLVLLWMIRALQLGVTTRPAARVLVAVKHGLDS